MFTTKLNEVLASKKSYIADSWNFVSLGTSGLLNIIHWTILAIKIRPGQTRVLLHYNVVTGSDLVQQSLYLYWIPLLALILLLLNVVVASIIYKKEKLAAHFINIATIPIQLIFLAATIILILANE
ncbi:MAG: hypothetical protein A2660_01125 [Candidatus Doudnabacteria bacterium RIFCSPHIGHO2_01_FULL_45_18]|uniref:Uncharacterized protein n=1 Tax=Candidatus Doudnabacteria bacterium RIFCSPHIGHO2_01_FULL_45_18 TaxID=1817823 RepID=A0A1F5NRJ6_9BACT|nr:MAG: hypothetical protein A2660_01125 [Candidatus Doudnabacteria bacterium RIFCSPHIGHO2_01_FULL_45_18]